MPNNETAQSQQEGPGGSWWAALEQFRTEVNGRLAEGDQRMTKLQEGVDENTRVTKDTNAKASEIFEFLNTLKSLLKFGDAMSKLAIKIWKPISYISASIAALGSLYLAWKSGGK